MTENIILLTSDPMVKLLKMSQQKSVWSVGVDRSITALAVKCPGLPVNPPLVYIGPSIL